MDSSNGICSIYLSNEKYKTGFVILKGGQKLKIRLSNILDIGAIIETYQRKVYSPDFLNLKNSRIKSIVDVGASIGDFSIFCASCFKEATILSYEPTQNAFELLKENIRLNNLEHRIKFYPLGVSAKGGKTKIGNDTYSSVSIDKIFQENEIDKVSLLKMDIEGAEYEILMSTPQEILQRINAIAMECHIFDKGENLIRLKDYLIETGFDVITTEITAHNICYLYAKRQ